MKLLLVISVIFAISSCVSTQPIKNFQLSDQDHSGYIQIHSSQVLNLPPYNGFSFAGVSDLAWDSNKKILYALTDRAILFHLKLSFADNKINTLSIVDAYALKDKQGERLKAWDVDSEGLDLHYDQNQQVILSVSFERHPRIVQYTTKGEWIREVKLPDILRDIASYHSPNKSLESVVYHSEYGLMTASEYPLKNSVTQQQRLYSVSGREWKFSQSPAKNSAVTALEVLPNNNILILERAWAGYLRPFSISLREVLVKNCVQGEICPSKKLAQLSTADGWQLDNFEGLTQLENRQYLMISDDNASPIQNTILVLFQVQE